MENTIILTRSEMVMAASVGCHRRLESVFEGRKNNRIDDIKTAWTVDIEGAAAELAFCKFRNKYWTGSVGSFKGADVDKDIQVRQTVYDNGSLIVRDDDNQFDYYVLVTGYMPKFKVVGWLRGMDARKDCWREDPGSRKKPCFKVPQAALKRFEV